jgi:hypothetical protein
VAWKEHKMNRRGDCLMDVLEGKWEVGMMIFRCQVLGLLYVWFFST